MPNFFKDIHVLTNLYTDSTSSCQNYDCCTFYSTAECSSQEFMMGVWILIIMYFGNIKCCYFCDKWKMQHLYIKNSFFSKPMGVLTPQIFLAMTLALYLVYECIVHRK